MFQYIMLLAATLMWSFVGILVKTGALMASSWLISFCRFFFGVVFLYVLILATKEKISLNLKNKWIWIGVIGKCANYFLENIALSLGFAYGNIIVWPTQTLLFAFISVWFLKEKMTKNKLIAVILCIFGIALASYNPRILDIISANSAFLMTVLFILSGLGAGLFLLAQKMLLNQMSASNMNFSIFLISSFVTAAPLPVFGSVTGSVSFWPVFSLVALGLITGISFYLNAMALKKVPLLPAVLISNSSVLLTILWSVVIFHEPVSETVVIGCILFLIGILFINMPNREGKKAI